MKITICGSMKFAGQMVDIYGELKKLGHDPQMHRDVFGIADGTAPQLKDEEKYVEHSEIKRKYNFIKWWHDCIKRSDAVLICNLEKNGIKNYIGGNTLMEIGFAHVNDKKVFLLNPVPSDVPYVDEIKAMVDEVIDGDLRKIN